MVSTDIQLRQLWEDALREAGEMSALQEDIVRADIELRYRHPGKYVAYIDRYRMRDKICRLVREVLACSTDLGEVKAAFSDMEGKKRARIRLEYLDPLGDAFETHVDLRLR